jgi:hypothetical protein
LKRPDGRRPAAGGRTQSLAFKAKPETILLIQRMAQVEGITMVETLERALDLYDRNLKGRKVMRISWAQSWA